MDPKLYQKTFDHVHMPDRRAEEVRKELAARRAELETEEMTMTNNKKRPMAAVIAVCAVLALSVTAFASGGQMLENMFKMLTGPAVEQGIDEEGNYYFKGDEEEAVSPVELRDDGRLYLIVNGENRDITDECSYETPYIYECGGEDGLRHTLIIGGEPEEIGWMEFASTAPDDGVAFSNAVFSIQDGVDPQTLPWLTKGLEQTMGDITVRQADSMDGEDGEDGEMQIFYFTDPDGNIEIEGEVSHEEVITLTQYPG